MSIKSELAKTADNLRRTRKAILGRGGEISETAGLKDLPEAIFNIPADTSLAFYTDEETAYEKVVPSNAEEYALLNRVGGMTYKCNNLFDIYRADFVAINSFSLKYEPKVEDGVMYSGGISGKSQGATIPIYLKPNTDYTFSCDIFWDTNTETPSAIMLQFISDIKDSIFSTTKVIKNIATQGKVNVTFNSENYEAFGIIAYSNNQYGIGFREVQLVEGSTALPYETYFEGLRNTKVTSLESRGKNLAQKQYGITSSGASVSATKIIEDKTGKVCSSLIPVIGGKKYTLSKTYVDTKSEFSWFFYDREPILNETQAIDGTYHPGSNKYTITIPDNATYLYVRWTSNEETSPCGDVQIELGAGVTEYKPYSAEPIDSYSIPEAVQSLEGYGLGVNAEYNNHIEFVNGRVLYHKVCETILLNGSERWLSGSNGRFFISDANSSLKKPVIADVGISDEWSLVPYSNISTSPIGSFCVREGGGIQAITSFDNPKILCEKLMSNPVTIIYAVAEPIIIDITAFFTNERFIRVEERGVIRAVNEHKQDAPSTIKYTVKVGS